MVVVLAQVAQVVVALVALVAAAQGVKLLEQAAHQAQRTLAAVAVAVLHPLEHLAAVVVLAQSSSGYRTPSPLHSLAV